MGAEDDVGAFVGRGARLALTGIPPTSPPGRTLRRADFDMHGLPGFWGLDG